MPDMTGISTSRVTTSGFSNAIFDSAIFPSARFLRFRSRDHSPAPRTAPCGQPLNRPPPVPGLEPFALLSLLKCSGRAIFFDSLDFFQEARRWRPPFSAELPFGTLSSDFSSRRLTPARATDSEPIYRASDVPVHSPFACHSLYRHFSFFDDHPLIVAICSFICGLASITARGRTFSEVPASECPTRERQAISEHTTALIKIPSWCVCGFWHWW